MHWNFSLTVGNGGTTERARRKEEPCLGTGEGSLQVVNAALFSWISRRPFRDSDILLFQQLLETTASCYKYFLVLFYSVVVEATWISFPKQGMGILCQYFLSMTIHLFGCFFGVINSSLLPQSSKSFPNFTTILIFLFPSYLQSSRASVTLWGASCA